MKDVTRVISAVEGRDPQAAGQLLPLVYEELRKLASQKLAHEALGQTLQATALVHARVHRHYRHIHYLVGLATLGMMLIYQASRAPALVWLSGVAGRS